MAGRKIGKLVVASLSVLMVASSTAHGVYAQASPARTLLDIKGLGDRTSRTFTVTAPRWSIHWSANCNGYIGAFLLDVGGHGPAVGSVLEMQVAHRSGVVRRRGAGKYHLEVVASHVCSWHLVVTEAARLASAVPDR
jgi:hypothetical protein